MPINAVPPIRDSTMLDLPKSPSRLIVLVPGFGGRCSSWAQLKHRLAANVPEFSSDVARWLDFEHSTHWWSLGTLEQLAEQLDDLVVAEWLRAGGYDDVILVGHSMGGLVVRQAYMRAIGAVPGSVAGNWGRRVTRIVLLASLNRGIESTRTVGARLVTWLRRVVPFCPHLRVQDVLRGSNFLTNLRINWIRHFGTLTEALRQGEKWPDGQPKRPPLVVQLLGPNDDIVHVSDSQDVLAFPDGHYLRVPGANHTDLYRTDVIEPERRFAVLKQGFAGEFAPSGARPDGDPIRQVVFLLHGIRATSIDKWILELEDRLKASDPGHVDVRHPTYGYFTAARFALPGVRRRNIRVFQDWYTEALAEHPSAEFNIVAHSNGSYILGQSLLVTPGMRFVNVALAGSVLPREYPWRDRMAEPNVQVSRVRNDRADRDLPVAVLCNALRGLRMTDVGTGGFDGFLGDATVEYAYFSGGHGAALAPQNQESLVDFVLGKSIARPPMLRESPGYFRQISNAIPYVSIAVVGLLLLGVAAMMFLGMWVPLLQSAVMVSIAYVILDIV